MDEEIVINGVTYFACRYVPAKIYPKRLDMLKWFVWWRFFGHKKPGPYSFVYIIDDPFTGQKMGMVNPEIFGRLKREVQQPDA
jgi:hypothetical protein